VIELVTHRGRYEVVASTALAILTLGGSVHALRIREAVFFGA
jgi:hypothetical protein